MHTKSKATAAVCLGSAVFVLLASGVTLAQDALPAPIPSHQATIAVDSGEVSNTSDVFDVVYSTVVRVPGAEWLRLNFDEVVLAGDPLTESQAHLLIVSLHDGAYQEMNATHVAQWQMTSAYFNGDAVQIEIYAPPGSGPNRLVMSEVTAGEPAVADRSICGPTDDRMLSDDPRACRALPIGCTAWLINDCAHCFLTAGHCAGSLDVMEFNVPLSDSGGSLIHPPPSDQYIVDDTSLQTNGGQGTGDDWAYFGCYANSTTGLTAFEAQGGAFDLAARPPDVAGQDIRITGYGTTSYPVSPTWNQVQKTHTGPYVTFSGTLVQYRTDTTGGNSGSPVIDESTGLAIGIHTHGGCDLSGGENSGTGINHSGLQDALANPRGICSAGTLEFSFPDDLPTQLIPSGGTTVRVVVSPGSGVTPEPGTGQLHYDAGDGLQTIAMQVVADNVYDAVFPASDCETWVEFFFSAEGDGGLRYYSPGGCNPPAVGYLALSAYGIDITAEDPFETDTGWTVGAPDDDATTGIWGRMDPQATAAQPGDDHTPSGTMCWVTDGRAGTGVGTYDIDGGKTTLFSPVYDLSGVTGARLSYWRWYSNDQGSAPGADVFVVDISNDGGDNWVNVETVGPSGAGTTGGWIRYEFTVSDVVTPTDAIQLRFIASDEDSGSVVEAALDDFQIFAIDCDGDDCLTDLDGDGRTDLADLAQLLAHYGTTSGAEPGDGDIDGDGDVDLADLASLLAVYDTDCP